MHTSPHDPPSTDATPGPVWTWRFRSDFGPWLRAQRLRHELTLKAASEALGVSFTRLHKLEIGGRVRAPSLELVQQIAVLYGRDLDEVLALAGFKVDLAPELRDAARCDEHFAALVLHPALRPTAMDERWVEAFSRIQKAQWIQFAEKLEAHLRGGGPGLSELLHAADAGSGR